MGVRFLFDLWGCLLFSHGYQVPDAADSASQGVERVGEWPL
jgi:hypothetical protein